VPWICRRHRRDDGPRARQIANQAQSFAEQQSGIEVLRILLQSSAQKRGGARRFTPHRFQRFV